MMDREKFGGAILEVTKERIRQDQLKSEGKFTYTLDDDGMDDAERVITICEEVGEVARNVLSRRLLVTDGEQSDTALIKELSQVAALSIAWMERLV